MNPQTRPAFRKPPWKQLWKGTAEGPYVCPDPQFPPVCTPGAPWGWRGRQCSPLTKGAPQESPAWPFHVHDLRSRPRLTVTPRHARLRAQWTQSDPPPPGQAPIHSRAQGTQCSGAAETGEGWRETEKKRMEKQPSPALLPEVPLARGETGEALGLWQPRPCLLPPISPLGWPPTCCLGEPHPSPAPGTGSLSQAAESQPADPPASLLGFLHPRPHRWWRQAAARGPWAGRSWDRVSQAPRRAHPGGLTGPSAEKSRFCRGDSRHVAADKRPQEGDPD